MSNNVSHLPCTMDDLKTLLNYTVSENEAKVYIDNFEKMVAEGTFDVEVKFQYAWCLIHSGCNQNISKASVLLEELFKEGTEEIKRDSLFYLAIAETKLKHYATAKKYIDGFLSVEPNNIQAGQLQTYIETHVKQDGVTGMALIGTAALLGGVAAVVVGTLTLGVALGFKVMGRRGR